ncbi:MAG: ClC family H(+)/Cl(-) exchange transporter [Erysipelotrichaceae bacterium]|nr:ClC family H(+)/Cl(-) exchange transporter [Erysipelotrichaceae bacterium]MDD3809350.1 ClC family H(+)/Cl(-) exchange transporter [Erysipelotrichaceae bacterium]
MNHRIKEIIAFDDNSRVRLIIEAFVVGILSGIVIVAYRWCLKAASNCLHLIIEATQDNVLLIGVWFLILGIMAYLVSLLVTKEPLISGSGIPQLEAELTGHLSTKWYRVLINKFIGGFLALFAGLSLGREGPSIQLGAMLGKGISKTLNRSKNEERYLMTCGASAGLAAAFHAPLAGVMFAIEEVHKQFSIALLLAVMTSSLTADYFISAILGMEPIFDFTITRSFTPDFFPILIVLGVILGFGGVIYNSSLLKIQKMYSHPSLNQFKKLLIPFMLAGVIAYTFPILLGGGDAIIEQLNVANFATTSLIVILIGKLLFSLISFNSGAPGGIFFPMLVLGSIIGKIAANIAVNNFGIDPIYVDNFIIVAMAGLFSSIVKAPVTGIILIFEMTGSLTSLLAISFVSIVSFIVSEICRSKPIYDSLLENLLKRNCDFEYQKNLADDKVLQTFFVHNDSPIASKKIKELMWPENVLLVSIKRGHHEIIPNGNTVVEVNDRLLVICNVEQQSTTYDYLLLLTSS